MPIQVEKCMPALYVAAEKLTAAGQTRFQRLIQATLGLLIVAAIVGLIEANWAGWVAAATFLGSIILTLLWTFRAAESDWYDGRAAAESAKSLTWKYAVGAEPFGVVVPTAEQGYLDALVAITNELRALDSALDPGPGTRWHAELAALRAQPLSARRRVYREQRLEDQRDWYARRAGEHKAGAQQWRLVMVALQSGGTIAGVLKGLDVIDVDLLSVLAAVAAAVAAWINALDYTMTARAYEFAALELDGALARIDASTDEEEHEWATLAADIEEAMSREHTMWRARRRGRPLA